MPTMFEELREFGDLHKRRPLFGPRENVQPYRPLCIRRINYNKFFTQITSSSTLFEGNFAQEKRCSVTMQVKEYKSAISRYVLPAQGAQQRRFSCSRFPKDGDVFRAPCLGNRQSFMTHLSIAD